VHPRQQPVGRYRGRRRLPKLPSRRYAAVVTTAVMGAGIVALAAGATLPDGKAGPPDPTRLTLSVQDRIAAMDKAARSKELPGSAANADQGAPDLWLLPVRHEFQITTLFAMRWGSFHYGIDMAAPYGTPYYAAHAGTVITARYLGGYGYGVFVDHGNGVLTVYGHSSKILVREGQHVEAGQALGLIGSTGYSTGNHLHFEVRVNEAQVDPLSWMRAHGVDIEKRLEAANGGVVVF
jgi:murein DD-endopeptidase MepM/ murein hydrolase activator NlpD